MGNQHWRQPSGLRPSRWRQTRPRGWAAEWIARPIVRRGARRWIPAPTLWLAAVFFAGAIEVRAGVGEPGFRADLVEARRLIERGRWVEAQRTILESLDEHERQPYVWVKRTEILSLFRECAFRHDLSEPKLRNLISGELLYWNEKTGQLTLRYRQDREQDFVPVGQELVHPALFQSLQVDLRLDFDPEAVLVLAPFRTASEFWWVFVARDVVSVVQMQDEEEILRESFAWKSPKKPEEIALHLELGRSGLEVRIDRDRIVRLPYRWPGPFQFGWDLPGDYRELVLKGNAGASWLDGLADAHVQRARRRFEEEYDPRRDLPRWFFLPPTAPPGDDTRSTSFQVKLSVAQAAVSQKVSEYLRQKRFREVHVFLDTVGPRGLPLYLANYYRAEAFSGLDKPSSAWRHCQASLDAEPGFEPARFLRLRLARTLGMRSEATREARELLAIHPRDAGLAETLVELLLLQGMPFEAREALEQSLANGVDPTRLAPLDDLLVRAIQGPSFGQYYRYESAHFDVVSEIDRGTCAEVARELEDALGDYQARIRRLPRDILSRFRVYVFRGRAGYVGYAGHLFGGGAHQTAGLFSPTLKQLLLWKVPEEIELLRSARHEAFHQYLDAIQPKAPKWWNEGMACYYERTGEAGGRAGGMVLPDYVRLLLTEPVPPLETVVLGDSSDFYAGGMTNYALSWGFLHFLRHSPAAPRRLFFEIQDAVLAEGAPEPRLSALLQDQDWNRLNQDFLTYIRDLNLE